ncbi:outer membrane protein W [Dysgonomonas sp. PFB1-18]|uniref:hypothetical protein n=1 Tax=unclassified Dysgonomonas TaxID=2630389 RepID=UPI002472F657|nr:MULTISPECIES: hypothetical protein [unclassified Dysgonomonas]MDH6307627.1 outer membrane protein W [Dysgonomonas sp. PF1-14]MDH6337545.1 outer membrane protein W [Dysgonomonas sp. PF1-16]MDH6378769.1 outer membrane protein W [Dysgonomonas sp. PFB1-18]MDH6399187.1 outer membrane protein W [Dysgonomonas sp. PF1-23]
MKKCILLFISLFPILAFGQYIGVGYQYADFKKHQFVATVAYPWLIPEKNGSVFLTSGLEYSTKAGDISGLNLKAASFSVPYVLDESKLPFIVQPGLDAGYLFGLNHAKDGVVLTPNLHFEYGLGLHLRVGYDYNVRAKDGQFFVRIAVGIGAGVAMVMKGWTK